MRWAPNPDDDRTADSEDLTLERFVEAQSTCYGDVIGELRGGAKRSHWMWFVFPQYQGLGTSGISRKFAIVSLAEARAFLAHPLLGARLRECVRLVLAIPGRSAQQFFGFDDVKLRSSMTLFELAGECEPIFGMVLDRLFDGKRDERTLALVAADLERENGAAT